MRPLSHSELIARLADDLRPVRATPQLRHAVLALIALWLTTAACFAIWPGARAIGSPVFLPVFLSCAVLALGSSCAALALCIPGREAAVRLGYAVCAIGVALILGLALSGQSSFPSASLGYLANRTMHDWTCVGLATSLAVPFLAGIAFFGRKGFVLRRWNAAFCAGVGSVAWGAMLVHALCAEQCAEHALGSHALAPAWGTPLLLIPTYIALRKRTAS